MSLAKRAMVAASLEFGGFLEEGFYTIHDDLADRVDVLMSQRSITADDAVQFRL
jgi:hypothetical protein